MGELSDFRIGQTVELQDGQTATVHFFGQTNFATGSWVGVALDDATGKNDGSVQGRRYFDCQPGHGMFVRPATTKILEQPTPKASGRLPPKANGEVLQDRKSMVAGKGRRESRADAAGAKRQSINAGSPTPGFKGPATGRILKSPTKSPTKHLGPTTSSGNSNPQIVSTTMQKLSAAGLRAARPSMGPPSAPASATRSSRQSIAGPVNGFARPTSVAPASSRASSNRMFIQPGSKSRLSSVGDESQASTSTGHHSPTQSPDSGVLSPPVVDELDEKSMNYKEAPSSQESFVKEEGKLEKLNQPEKLNKSKTSRSRSPSIKPEKVHMTNSATPREVENLQTKLRVMEKKRMEDREKLKTLERVQAERDKFEGIIQKLQSKYQPQQQEAQDLRRQLYEMDAKIQDLEKQQAENDTIVEVATLDREMAEETAETLRSELDALKQSHEELNLEVEVLREENQELGNEMSPEEKTSQGWLQMERSNERLREALMRLRDMTQEQETDLRAQIRELEGDVHDLKGAKEEQTRLEGALEDSKLTAAELRQQLEAALGAEDMIEELTEKNLGLNEQIEDLRASIEELESLKELNDELEIDHTENARQMQEEIESNKTLLAEQAKKASLQDQTIQDLEYTVTRFQNLVTSMQTDLEDMRTTQQLTEAEANDLNSRSRAMMDLNLRLQVSASQAQVKVIELELGKLEAQESAEHLSIVQHFLPDTFRNERNSVRAYLRFRRIKATAEILHGHVKEKASRPPAPGHEDNVFVCCDVMDKLTFVAQTCNRFEKSIQSSDLDAFNRLEGALFDLEPVERAFNGWVEAAKRDELKEDSCASELSRTIALMTHLAEIHINNGLERYAEDIRARAVIMQSQLESALLSIVHVKSVAVAKFTQPGFVLGDGEDPDMKEFTRKSESLVAQMRGAKVIMGKAIRHLDDLQSRSLTLDQTCLSDIEQTQTSISDLSVSTRTFGHAIINFLNEERQSGSPKAHELLSATSSIEPPLTSLPNKLQTATTNLQSLYNLTSSLSHTVEFTTPSHPPPWQLLAEKLANESIAMASHEAEISRLNDETREQSTALAFRDKYLEELRFKVETLEQRASESQARRERVRKLENVMEAAEQRESELINTVNRLRSERNDLRTERDALVAQTGGAQGSSSAAAAAVPSGSRGLSSESESSTGRIQSLEAEIMTLQAAIRHLRSTAHAHTISSAWNFIGKPLIPQPSPQEQRARLRQSEAKGLVSELLRLATDPANGVVRLRERKRDERLGWRPARDTCSWQVARAREEWETWREWRDDLGGRRGGRAREGQTRAKAVVA
ncbi:MAG: hypothetical protein Q9184_005345 [Pyrenodesmia sp. 2 TL-2023]